MHGWGKLQDKTERQRGIRRWVISKKAINEETTRNLLLGKCGTGRNSSTSARLNPNYSSSFDSNVLSILGEWHIVNSWWINEWKEKMERKWDKRHWS